MSTIDTERKTIRDYATRLGLRYRITGTGQVDFYGRMPNSTAIGWYLFARDVTEAIDRIGA